MRFSTPIANGFGNPFGSLEVLVKNRDFDALVRETIANCFADAAATACYNCRPSLETTHQIPFQLLAAPNCAAFVSRSAPIQNTPAHVLLFHNERNLETFDLSAYNLSELPERR